MATEKQLISLYNWSVNINFYPNSHRYMLLNQDWTNGWYIKSVSSITWIIDKPFLKQWAVNCMRDYLLFILNDKRLPVTEEKVIEASKQWSEISNEAKDIGTWVHDWIEQFINSKLKNEDIDLDIPTEDRIQNWIMAFLNWFNSSNIQFLASEKFVYSKENNYCGKFDNSFIQDWKRILWDFKTSARIYPEYIMQCIGYIIADEEENWVEYDWLAILRFDKETWEFETFYLYKKENQELFEACKKSFLWALTLKNALEQVDKLLKK